VAKKVIIVAESDMHLRYVAGANNEKLDGRDVEFINMVFIPQATNAYTFNCGALDNHPAFEAILNQMRNDEEIYLAVAFDADENGELMAAAMFECLRRRGIDPERIFRMPLAVEGFVVLREFQPIGQYMVYRREDSRFRRLSAKYGDEGKIGLKKAVAPFMVEAYKKRLDDQYLYLTRAKRVDKDGSNTATFLTKLAFKEGPLKMEI
jgi:hypothetical protein